VRFGGFKVKTRCGVAQRFSHGQRVTLRAFTTSSGGFRNFELGWDGRIQCIGPVIYRFIATVAHTRFVQLLLWLAAVFAEHIVRTTKLFF